MPARAIVAVGQPRNATVPQPAAPAPRYEDFLAANGLADSAGSQMKWVVMGVVAYWFLDNTIVSVPGHLSRSHPHGDATGTGPADILLDAAKLAPVGTRTEEECVADLVWRQKLNCLFPAIYDLFMNMVMCYQVKTLNEGNMGNQLASQNIGEQWVSPILWALPYLAFSLDRVDLSTQGPAIAQNKFLQYHTAASSLGSLYSLSMACFPVPTGMQVNGATGVLFGPTETAALNAIVAAPYDAALLAAVSQVTIAKIYYVLMAADRLPGRWYMGMRSANAIPDGNSKQIQRYVKKANALSATLVEDATDLAGAVAAVRTFLVAL